MLFEDLWRPHLVERFTLDYAFAGPSDGWPGKFRGSQMFRGTIARSVHALSAAMALAVVSGCSTLPNFDTKSGAPGPTVTDVLNHIQCEIQESLKPDSAVSKALGNHTLILYANLTLDVTNNQGLTPSVNFLDTSLVAPKSFTATVSGQLSGVQHRSMNVAMTLDLKESRKVCEDVQKNETTFGLTGKLGLDTVMLTGLLRTNTTELIYPVAEAKVDGTQIIGPTFGSAIDFTIIYGAGGAPKWVMTDFSAPQGPTGLFNLSRAVKDTLILSFSRAPKPKLGATTKEKAVEDAQYDAAVKGAQDGAARMILQRVLPTP